MASSFVGAIDQGTTSSRFIIYDESKKVVAFHQQEHEQICPRAGWVEHDPVEIIKNTRNCIVQAIAKARAKGYGQQVDGGIRAVGITNQRETTVVWSRSTGKPLVNAIVWMDMRTSAICKELEQSLDGGRNHFRHITGLPITSYFSAVKLKWLLENVPEVKAAADAGDALFGTMDSWLIWNLTRASSSSSSLSSSSSSGVGRSMDSTAAAGGGGEEGVHVTDCSNASRTMLMDLKNMTWHSGIAEALGIPMGMLPRIVSNAEEYGVFGKGWPLEGVPIAGCLGDQHSAMLGQLCRKGEAKSTYGTGCFILLNTGDSVIRSTHGLLSTMGFKLGPTAVPQYALEGSIAIAGAAVQWLRDNLGIIKTSSEVETLAGSVLNTGGVYFVPAFSGLFAPWWREDARGVCVGLTRYSTKAHIARAVLEGICYQVRAVIDAMKVDLEKEIDSSKSFMLRVDGGATKNNLLMQLQADLLGCKVVRPEDVETTALGAALAAGVGVGLWTEQEIFKEGTKEENNHKETDVIFEPTISEEERQKRYSSWIRAAERSMNLADLH